ncbi:hypothetical protein L1987_39664 [Smallanthus sonchifolius]|uniref:Uncharacterized protein n=1 Tax=Smallanthus sonchifolius TaxID=185202 RepID=A0ACB9HQ65_9ASTR|nr:hypothetical protein L1987_39664 [Smallanthus sonchifolius]
MFNSQTHNFVIQIHGNQQQRQPQTLRTSNFSAMKIFNRFRRIFMRIMFSIQSSKGTSSSGGGSSGIRRRSCDRPDPPRASCNSSYYTSNTHYNEAISDCIEFFNKSSSSSSSSFSQDSGKISDEMV